MNNTIKNNLLLLLLFIPIISGCAEREYFNDIGAGPSITGLFKEIKGNISGVLTSKDSPYLVKDDIFVDSSSTLIIEPGVELYFDQDKSLIVKGKLISEGQRFSRIYFLPYRNSWEGVKIINSDSPASFRFCSIRKISSTDNNYIGSVLVYNSEATFINCYFEGNAAHAGGAIGSIFSNVEIINVIFDSNQSQNVGGAISAEHSDIRLINNVFNENRSSSLGAGVIIRNSIRTEVQNNIFYRNFYNDSLSHLVFLSVDSSNYIEQYNYIATDNMNPFFISENNFKLIYSSPCKNAGNPDSEFNDTDGTRNDQGAYGGPFGNW